MGAWSWGVGGNGGDRVFGNTLTKEDFWPVFRRSMELGLNLWDTAAVYGMGASETILGKFVDDCDRDDLYISTKFTPQIAKDVEHPTETMMDESLKPTTSTCTGSTIRPTWKDGQRKSSPS